MQHFLLTRFNLKHNVGISEHEFLGLSEEWLTDRFRLFENFCMPSVLGQSTTNFNWILLFDKQTPTCSRTHAEQLVASYPNTHLLFINGYEELITGLQAFIGNFITPSDKYIITTRLDNDDIIHKDFIKSIQDVAEPNELIIDIRRGYQMQIKDKGFLLREHYAEYNPFISIVESVTDFKTVLSKAHKDWKFSAEKKIVIKKPIWIEYVHLKNLSNRPKPLLPISLKDNLNDFQLHDISPSMSKFKIRMNNILLYPLMVLFKFYETYVRKPV